MKKTFFSLILLSGSLYTNAQHLLQALDTSEPEIQQIELPSGVTIGSSKTFIASVYDQNYLPYERPNSEATWERNINPDNQNEEKIIDYQGVIPSGGFYVYIPIKITSASSVEIPNISQHITIPAHKTEDGVSRVLTLTIIKGTYRPSDTHIRARLLITAGEGVERGDLKVKKLDLNSGLGYDYQGVELAKFTFNSSYENNKPSGISTFEVRAIPGIPDRNIDTKTTIRGVEGYNHQFLYMPVVGPDGKIWLNNNLGADYANINSEHFSPNTQAGGDSTNNRDIMRDKKAFGSLFQWLRSADGHELVKWGNTIAETEFSEWQYEQWEDPDTEPNHSKFIHGGGGTYWRFNVYTNKLNHWKSNGLTNPCPYGFHVPTRQEMINLTNWVVGNPDVIRSREVMRQLRFPEPGKRYHNGGADFKPEYMDWNVTVWTSDMDIYTVEQHKDKTGWQPLPADKSSYAYALSLDTSRVQYVYGVGQNISYIGDGIAVRCIQD